MALPAASPEPAQRDIIVVGASAGGVEALKTLVGGLPYDLAATVFVALHLPEGGTSALSWILDQAGRLPASAAEDGAAIAPGTILVAPPDHHLFIEDGRTRLLRGPKVNGHRPAVDVLFYSAAQWHGPSVIGVVLSGSLHDGALGLRAIKRHGGAAIVQSDAPHRGMPESAIASAEVDACVPVEEIPARLIMLMQMSEAAGANGNDELGLTEQLGLTQAELLSGTQSVFTCPECGGPIWELGKEGLGDFACHVGHRFSTESMLELHGSAVERALWGAVRILDERAALVTRLADRMTEQGQERSAQNFVDRAREAAGHADVIRSLLEERSVGEDSLVQEA